MKNKNKKVMDAVLIGSVEWSKARDAAFKMAGELNGEVAELQKLTKIQDAYSPMAWFRICRQMQVVTEGMTVMRLLAEGKTPEQIAAETGITRGSIAAFRAWNTMYRNGIHKTVDRKIKIKGRTEAEQQADADFLRSCGISIDLIPRESEVNGD